MSSLIHGRHMHPMPALHGFYMNPDSWQLLDTCSCDAPNSAKPRFDVVAYFKSLRASKAMPEAPQTAENDPESTSTADADLPELRSSDADASTSTDISSGPSTPVRLGVMSSSDSLLAISIAPSFDDFLRLEDLLADTLNANGPVELPEKLNLDASTLMDPITSKLLEALDDGIALNPSYLTPSPSEQNPHARYCTTPPLRISKSTSSSLGQSLDLAGPVTTEVA